MRVAQAKGGFTLIEMAVVLVIVGLILTVTLPLLTEGIQRDKLVKGRQAASSLRDEIVGYALTHAGVLPSLSTVATFASAEDPWGNLIAYWSDPALTQGTQGADICSLSSAPNNLSLQDVNTGSTYPGVAFIIASRGANMNLQMGYAAGTPVVVTTYPSGYDDSNFNDLDHTAVLGASYDLTPAREERFDDVVQYVTYNYLYNRICTSEFGDQRTHAAVTFDDMANNFDTTLAATGTDTSYANQAGAVEIDAASGEVSLGNENTGAVGCLWWNGNNASLCGNPNQAFDGLCSNGTAWKKARFVFKFTVTSTDESLQSTDERGGFVFTFMGVGANVNDGGTGTGAEAPCGRGDNEQYLGYTGEYPDGTAATSTVPNLVAPKYGVEVDYFTTAAMGDPRNADMSASQDPTSGAASGLTADEDPNHIAVVFWGTTAGLNNDNAHGTGTLGSVTQPLNPDWDQVGGGTIYNEFTDNTLPLDANLHARVDGFMSNATHKPSTTGTTRTHWLEDGKDHWLRIVYERFDVAPLGTWDTADKLYVHVWVSDNPSAAFKNVGADLLAQDPHGQIGYDLYENSTQGPAVVGTVGVDSFRFGWTTATGATNPTTTILSDFAFNLGN